jgi:outer membrane beta-barrel protein
MTTKYRNILTRLLSATLLGSALLAFAPAAEAQEILLTGPLAGAPATRKLRLHREGRFEFAPAVTFTLLDEYRRTIFLGARIGYNFTDWLAIGAWGGYGGLLQLNTSLTDHIQVENKRRIDRATTAPPVGNPLDTERRLTAVNLGPDFEEQLGGMDWVLTPQITVTPFRGKLALFQSIYLDTDLYVFGGPAFIGITERADCTDCVSDNRNAFPTATRMAITGSFGAGLSFYINEWAAVGWEYRLLPFSWNRGGFDTAGGGKDEEFPDNKITSADRRFDFKQLMTISFIINMPFKTRISE